MRGRGTSSPAEFRPDPFAILAFAGAILGLLFAAVSTFDFAQHLDRQVHSIHCSFIPGATGDDSAGCQTTMMSPYSSVMRTWLWGGVPISLPAMAVFAFLAFFAVDLVVTDRQRDRRATAFFTAAAALPVLVSAIMAYVSLVELDTTCTQCMGIYLASAMCLAGAIGLLVRARRDRRPAPARPVRREATGGEQAEPAWVGSSDAAVEGADPEPVLLTEPKRSGLPTPVTLLLAAFAIGVLFVLSAVTSYVVAAPDHGRFIGTCGGLTQPDDPYGVMVDLGGPKAGAPKAVEVLDPLCPACRAFEERLDASGHARELDRRAVLFPLDNTCNWMVNEAIHPGACAVSEAVLCAGSDATSVVEWAFENQEEIREATAARPEAAAEMVSSRFPELAKCIGKPEVKSRLNKSLRWAVTNGIQVLTPQLFVDGVKLCDEDVDLGLEFALDEMLARREAGTLRVIGAEASEPGKKPEAPAAPAEPAVVPETETETGTETETETETGTETETETETETGTETETETETETKTGTGTGTETETGTGTGTETETETGTGTGTETDPETETETETEPEPEPEPEPDSDEGETP
jgi:uncharacterized membrane protein